MIIEGLKLTLLGMLVVFLFLTLLILMVKLSASLLRNYGDRELAEMMLQDRRATTNLAAEDRKLVGVISAALAVHMARHRK